MIDHESGTELENNKKVEEVYRISVSKGAEGAIADVL